MAQSRQNPVIWLTIVSLLLLSACTPKPAEIKPLSEPLPSPHPIVDQQPKAIPAVVALDTARSMLGVGYHYGGTDPRGFDCSGLVQYSYRQAGVSLPRTSQEMFRASTLVNPAEVRPGDLVFFKISSRKVSHVGIYAGNRTFIHSPSSGKGVSYANLDSDYWGKRLIGVGRI